MLNNSINSVLLNNSIRKFSDFLIRSSVNLTFSIYVDGNWKVYDIILCHTLRADVGIFLFT